MNKDLANAINLLNDNNLTCVLCKDDIIYTTTMRGVAPLLAWISDKKDMKDFCVADKVVGRAAAFLYVILGVSQVYAKVMSKGAIKVLMQNDIRIKYDTQVEYIINRTSTGMCPMEEAVWNINDCNDALDAITKRLDELKNNKVT